jgi:hypothetical protein
MGRFLCAAFLTTPGFAELTTVSLSGVAVSVNPRDEFRQA